MGCNGYCPSVKGAMKNVGRKGFKKLRYCAECAMFFPLDIYTPGALDRKLCVCCHRHLRTKPYDKKLKQKRVLRVIENV